MTLQDELNGFFDALFDPADTVEIRFLKPLKTKSNQWYQYPGAIVHEWEDIEQRNNKQDVYFGVNPREGRGGTAESIKVCRCVFADFDHTTTETALNTIEQSGLPEPTVLVNSGHGAHAYWRLEEAIDVPQWRAIQLGLIELLKCDDKIHDAPRIMRMPGSKHVSKHQPGTADTYCVIEFNRMTRHDVEDIVMRLPVVEAPDYGDTPSLPDGERGPLPSWAHRFLIEGAMDGERNAKCFSVACCMSGAGWPIEDAKLMLLAAAERCVPPLNQGETLASIKSAYQQERSPATPDPDTLPLGSSWQIQAVNNTAVPEFREDEPDDAEDWLQIGDPINEHTVRSALANVMESVDKEGNTMTHPQTVQQVVASLHEATGGWPRRAGGMLFVPGEQAKLGELPPDTATRRLVKVDELFAWIQAKTSMYWAEAKKCTDQLTGESRTSLKRVEFFEHMRETLQPAYDAAETLPHYPPAEKTWYAPARLPKRDRSLVSELCDRLNWHTDIDRGLLEAALLTLFWGGRCGQRPAFVLSSQFGAGAGKSTTVMMLTRVVGGYMEMMSKEDPELFSKRLLSDGALRQRAVLLDNVKSKMDVAGIEAMITAKEISGHRMYYGHATRPNRLTWFITANAPQLSHDLAERSMSIHIGAQKANAKWQNDLENCIDENCPAIVAACLDALSGPDACTIEDHNLDRWAAWQAGVLAKISNGNEIAAAMRERRHIMDSDMDDADEIAMVIRALIRRQGVDADTCKAFIERRTLADALNIWQDEDGLGRRKTISYINNRVGGGALKQVKATKLSGDRGYIWMGDACMNPDHYATRITDLPADFSIQDVRDAAEDAGGNA